MILAKALSIGHAPKDTARAELEEAAKTLAYAVRRRDNALMDICYAAAKGTPMRLAELCDRAAGLLIEKEER